MKTLYTFRQGRSFVVEEFKPGTRRRVKESLLASISGLVILALLAAHLAAQEYNLATSTKAFSEIGPSIVPLHDAGIAVSAGNSQRVGHLSSSRVRATVSDPDFGVKLQGGLKLRRQTEYCQWQEIEVTRCSSRKASSKCVHSYYYRKGWHSHLIPSLLFNQPATHHNPMRNPFPSRDIVSTDAIVGNSSLGGGVHLSPELLSNPKGGLRLADRVVDFGPEAATGGALRIEKVDTLHAFVQSPAYKQHNFAFSNRDGWFFSAYEESRTFGVLRGFGQYLEGSLFDWQIGDVFGMFTGCTPGDIRVRFHVADPTSVTAIGQVSRSPAAEALGAAASLGISTDNSVSFPVGFVHSGLKDTEDALNVELGIFETAAWWARATALLAGLGVWALVYGARTLTRPMPDAEQAALAWEALAAGPLLALGGVWLWASPGSDLMVALECCMIGAGTLLLTCGLPPEVARQLAGMFANEPLKETARRRRRRKKKVRRRKRVRR